MLEVVGPSILQQKLETRWNIVFLMDKKAFGALRSSQSSLSSLWENSSGLCLNEKFDLQMSSPRNSSGFGVSGCSFILTLLCCIAYLLSYVIPLQAQSRMDRCVWKATALDFVGKLKLKASSVLSVQVWELCLGQGCSVSSRIPKVSPVEQLAVAFSYSCR